MYQMGIIEESLDDKAILGALESCLVSKKIECVPGDEYPEWHVNEYHIEDKKVLNDFLDKLANELKKTWYVHVFNKEELYVIMYKKWFQISVNKDETWEKMIKYGVDNADVERYYLENISLSI